MDAVIISFHEQVRAEFGKSEITKTRKNKLTNREEYYMPIKYRVQRLIGAVSVVSFFVTLVLIAVLGVVVFRAAFSVVLVASGNPVLQKRSKYIVSGVAGCLNLLAINVLKVSYLIIIVC